MKYKLILGALIVVGALSNLGCDEEPVEQAKKGCSATFSGPNDGQTYDSCIDGVDIAEDKIHGSFQDYSNPPNIHVFRTFYNEVRNRCSQLYRPAPLVEMSCLDGVDGYSAAIAFRYGFQTGEYGGAVLDQNYFATHDYTTVYNDFQSDDQWLYFLMHRVFFPEYYPGYRRDQYYMVIDPLYAYGTPGYFGNGYGYSYYHFYTPVRPFGVGYAGTWGGSNYFGPAASPRPYASGTPWYNSARPGMPGSTLSSTATHFKPGSYTFNSDSAAFARTTPFGGFSGSNYATAATTSRGGFGSSFSGGGDSSGG